jgi:hypothetical protein
MAARNLRRHRLPSGAARVYLRLLRADPDAARTDPRAVASGGHGARESAGPQEGEIWSLVHGHCLAFTASTFLLYNLCMCNLGPDVFAWTG